MVKGVGVQRWKDKGRGKKDQVSHNAIIQTKAARNKEKAVGAGCSYKIILGFSPLLFLSLSNSNNILSVLNGINWYISNSDHI